MDRPAPPAPVFVTLGELSRQMGVELNGLYALARRAEDPLPAYYIEGKRRGAVVLVSDLSGWFERNRVPYAEARRKT
ncbi:MAG: hypothetical protein SOW20_01480 [Berryella intestinalis]|uniref:hypothetical protein n=1 Tax=Berryella intestinalis TaxID=1531429 RepID=UPI002A762021|nr:hypothetical protein [Berryella intestinalis]MDY3128685.1 hypothetical protein [Berryella intestinalis]